MQPMIYPYVEAMRCVNSKYAYPDTWLWHSVATHLKVDYVSVYDESKALGCLDAPLP